MCPFLNPTKAVQFGLQPFKGFAPFPFRNRLFQIFFVHIGRNFQAIINIYSIMVIGMTDLVVPYNMSVQFIYYCLRVSLTI